MPSRSLDPWPDFTGENLATAMLQFRRRDRRFGAIVQNGSAGADIQPLGSDT